TTRAFPVARTRGRVSMWSLRRMASSASLNERTRTTTRQVRWGTLHDSLLAKRGDGGGIVAEIRQHEIGVLAEPRWTGDDVAWRLRQPHRCTRHRRGIRQTGIIHSLQETGGANVRMVQRLLRAQDRCCRDFCGCQRIDGLLRGAL